MNKSETQRRYGSNTEWSDERLEKYDPHRPDRLFEALDNGHIFPDNLDGFVLVSMGSNDGRNESKIAQRLSERVGDDNPPKKPIVVAADFYGLDGPGSFRPAFSPRNPSTEYPKASFIRLSADASEGWLRPNAVDVLMDDLGPIWHACSNNDLHAVFKLLKRYHFALKPSGVLLLDDCSARVGSSTIDMLELFGKLRVMDGRAVEPIPHFSLEKLLARAGFKSEGRIGSHRELFLLLRKQ